MEIGEQRKKNEKKETIKMINYIIYAYARCTHY